MPRFIQPFHSIFGPNIARDEQGRGHGKNVEECGLGIWVASSADFVGRHAAANSIIMIEKAQTEAICQFGRILANPHRPFDY